MLIHRAMAGRSSRPQWQDELGASASTGHPGPSATPYSAPYQQAAGPSRRETFGAPSHMAGGPGGTGAILCHCGLPTKALRSTKDNENKDRTFHVCDKGQHAGGCTFFQWGEPAPSPPSLYAAYGTPASGHGYRGEGGTSRGPGGGGPTSSSSTSPVVCFQCGQPNHFAAQCPTAFRGR